jgi:hypothetical protein
VTKSQRDVEARWIAEEFERRFHFSFSLSTVVCQRGRRRDLSNLAVRRHWRLRFLLRAIFSL